MEHVIPIRKINQAYQFVLKNQRSNFYRNKYKKYNLPKKISSLDDFQKLPFLTKEDLAITPPFKRLFLPLRKIVCVEPTSGTTGKNLLILQGYPKEERLIWEKDLQEYKVKSLMSLSPTLNISSRIQSNIRAGTLLISGDIKNLELSAQIAADLEIDAVKTSPSILLGFLEHLEKVYSLKRIKYVSLGGEFCTSQMVNFFKKKLPNSQVRFTYGGAETLRRGYQCKFLSKSSLFHPIRDLYIEIIDPETGELLPEGEDGEIITTNLSLDVLGTPLLRYRTQDAGSIKKYNCACGANYILNLSGRANFDLLKIGGAVIHVQSIQNALSKAYISGNDFKLHVFERVVNGKFYISLELELVLGTDNNLRLLADRISRAFYITPKLTLQDFVSHGLFSPLKILPVKKIERKTGEKIRHIIAHTK